MEIEFNLQLFAETSTKIKDVIVPEVFNQYVLNRTTELSALVKSGIVAQNPELNSLAVSGGKIIQMPHWNDLAGESQLLSDTEPLKVNKITSGQDQARLQLRGNAWGANDLAGALAGSDPMRAIAEQVADFWAQDDQRVLLNTLDGVFASATMKDNVLDVTKTENTTFDGKNFLQAQFKLGDAFRYLTAIAVHSSTYSHMLANDMIEFIPDSMGAPIAKYRGLDILIDDGMPEKDGVFTSYLFGQGALGYANVGAPVPTEVGRDRLAGEDYLINRRHFILHPRGVKWTESTVTGETPSNKELAMASNWSRVFDKKKIRIVKFTHSLEQVKAPETGK